MLSVLGTNEGGGDVVAALGELERMGIVGPAIAAWIRTVEVATSRTPRPDLVWSGPEVQGLHARDTRRVYEELLGSAERSVWVSTYIFFDGPKAFALARRMDANAAAEHSAKVGRHDRRWAACPKIRGQILGNGLAGIVAAGTRR
jgi:hypothetical protein